MKHHDRRLIPRTLLQIFTYVAITTLVMVVSLAGILYRDYEKIGLRTAYEYNIRYLRQISYNIAQMNDFIVQYCITQYSEPDMQNFLYTSEIGDAFYFNYIKSIGKLQNTVLISPMIHSVVVYNSYLDKVYSTSPFSAMKTLSSESCLLTLFYMKYSVLFHGLSPTTCIIVTKVCWMRKLNFSPIY